MSRQKRKLFLPFLKARRKIRSLGLNSAKEWRQYRKTTKLNDIPANPDQYYIEEWQGWGDWLGTGRIAEKDKVFRSYAEASLWAQENRICSDNEWREAVKSGRIPSDIPRNPRLTYKDKWTTSGDFYGTGFVAYSLRKWVSFKKAKTWASNNGITCREDWIAASKLGFLPENIPAHPVRVYEECKGGWSALFDNAVRGGSSFVEEVIAHELQPFLHIDREIRTVDLGDGRRKRIDLASKNLRLLIEYDGWYWHRKTLEKDKSETELLKKQGWRVVRVREAPLSKITNDDCVVMRNKSIHQRVVLLLRHLLKLSLISTDMQSSIEQYVIDGKLSTVNSNLARAGSWLDYSSAKEWVRREGIKSSSEYRRYVKENRLHNDIPSVPEIVYEAEWRGWPAFLGTDRVYSKPGGWRSYDAARQWVIQSGISNYKNWRLAVKEGQIPKDIPRKPDTVYKSEWISFAHWFGGDVQKGQRRPWLSFESARDWVRTKAIKSESGWRKFVKQKDFPNNIPKSPNVTYHNKWIGWGDWLGTQSIAPQKRKYLSFEEARQYVRSLGLGTEADWRAYKSKHSLPPTIPRKPEHVYRHSGWSGFKDWLVG